ncbi:MAG: hypothetical protein BECKG1743D_GA0114223_108271 [Candidatus Kentron sp. G]|nr:MAG: hypothetical protein BECKG1743E_GA0114224_104754 [Candidatus Kentron sp. G]VFN02297.1 MAG: hypothetical protein BECKG1743F_GA0114225_106711 [Candidatus Kentron sp. G]VFN06199.1 MAG: hypothetical protein BECKG1743D_GA0114223_108271 [Candidatus Kentron sp. G]
MIFERSDAFIALPGGYGTLEEIMELVTWAQIGSHKKPCGLINVAGYFDGLLSFLDQAVSEGFLEPEHREMLLVSEDPEEMLERMAAYRVPEMEQWWRS